ncbi:GNAT family N-acetyltransferase [Antrihabitans cavernicola]|uniref:N-acetyltransferase n=1 Tax=Antrihabitans cavernicola TaxID=2495913 RepID=A0A5A7S8F3_9NOCA|nr:GNAT family N-acetyltransferase [Spelaeibacter cavernicola]KAA0022438.1 N-acetyltransferase [Spelaeibacter cavernicola]
MSTRIEHKPELSRFEIFSDDELAGYAEYAERPGVRDFNHTLTFPQFRGRGLAAQVVQSALNTSREQGFKVMPTCWFVDEFINGHAEYKDLVA